MKPHLTLLSALLIVVTVCSCSKNTDHTNEGTVLTRYTTTFRDTLVYYYIYDRDANNRILSMRDSTKAYEYKTTLTYGSNGKVEKVLFMNGASVIYSYEFLYNSDGRISKRKIRVGAVAVGENYNIYVYDAAGNLTTDSAYSTVNNTTFTLTSFSKFKYTGKNITEAEYYTVFNGTPALNTHIKYEYDNGINPFRDMEYEYYINEAGSAIYTIPLKSGNNALKAYTADSNGGWDLMQNSTYQYNSSQYAWKAITQNVTGTQPAAVSEYYFQ